MNPFVLAFILGTAAFAAIVAAVVWLTGGRTSRLAPSYAGMAPPLAPAFTAADAFTGTPAETWADGADGVTSPRARAVGGFSAAQVWSAYRTTRRLLVAADLNPRTLAGDAPTAFADLLAPQLRRFFWPRLRSTRTWVTSFAPGTTELVGTVIKVHGAMKALAIRDSGRPVLRIHADFIFVYPVQRPGQPETRMRIVAQDDVNVDFAQWNDPGGPLEAWWLPTATSGPAGALCDVHDGFVHPDFPGRTADMPEPMGVPVNPYLMNPAPFRGACEATTGT